LSYIVFLEQKMPGKYKSDELRKLIIEAKQRGEKGADIAERYHCETMVPAPKSQHSGHEVAKPESGSQSNRAFVGGFKASRSWKKV
jgi:hypothetical protein